MMIFFGFIKSLSKNHNFSRNKMHINRLNKKFDFSKVVKEVIGIVLFESVLVCSLLLFFGSNHMHN